MLGRRRLEQGLRFGHGATVELRRQPVAVERRSGLANLRQRAEHYGGSFVFSVGDVLPAQLDQEGTRLQWTIPLT